MTRMMLITGIATGGTMAAIILTTVMRRRRSKVLIVDEPEGYGTPVAPV